MSETSAKHTPERPRWTVQFSFRCEDEQQRRVIDGLGLLAHDVVRAYLKALMPDSIILELEGALIKQILFRRRRDMRRFHAVWGGKLLRAGHA
jgi:hypothetical protein